MTLAKRVLREKRTLLLLLAAALVINVAVYGLVVVSKRRVTTAWNPAMRSTA